MQLLFTLRELVLCGTREKLSCTVEEGREFLLRYVLNSFTPRGAQRGRNFLACEPAAAEPASHSWEMQLPAEGGGSGGGAAAAVDGATAARRRIGGKSDSPSLSVRAGIETKCGSLYPICRSETNHSKEKLGPAIQLRRIRAISRHTSFIAKWTCVAEVVHLRLHRRPAVANHETILVS